MTVSFLPVPRGVYPSISHIDPQALAAKGIKLVLADLDNTLVPYKVPEPTAEVFAWKQALEAAGIELFLLSNSRKPTRPSHFAQALGIRYIGHAGKPKKGGYLRALEMTGCTVEQTAMVGDQIFTDILGAARMGIVPLLVEPIRLAGNPGRYIRYGVETPFRALGRRRPFV